MEKSEIKGFIAKRCAKELKNGDVVNLGIGLPTMIPSYLPEGVELIIHAELGIVSAGTSPPGSTTAAFFVFRQTIRYVLTPNDPMQCRTTRISPVSKESLKCNIPTPFSW